MSFSNMYIFVVFIYGLRKHALNVSVNIVITKATGPTLTVNVWQWMSNSRVKKSRCVLWRYRLHTSATSLILLKWIK